METDYEMQKAEAISRLKKLGVSDTIIQDFDENGHLYMAIPPSGKLNLLKSETYDQLHNFEKEKNIVFYVAIRSISAIGITDAYLCVSQFKDDWAMESEGIEDENKGVLAYVFNQNDPHNSEFGFVWIHKIPNGGIIQIG